MSEAATPTRTDALRVLIAEDEHLVAAGLAAAVRTLGHECIGIVGSGADACAQAETLDADIVLMDIQMPGEDGLTAAGRLWDQSRIPSIIVSAFADRDNIERSQRPGVFGYILKPTCAQQLDAAITVACARADEAVERDERVDHLQSTLENRRIIEKAKWHLVATESLSEADAHARIQRLARESRRRAVDIAAELLQVPATPPSAI